MVSVTSDTIGSDASRLAADPAIVFMLRLTFQCIAWISIHFLMILLRRIALDPVDLQINRHAHRTPPSWLRIRTDTIVLLGLSAPLFPSPQATLAHPGSS